MRAKVLCPSGIPAFIDRHVHVWANLVKSSVFTHGAEIPLLQHRQPVLLNERQELERRLPLGRSATVSHLLDRRWLVFRLPGKDRLADMVVLAQRLEFAGRQFLRENKAIFIEGPHRFLVDGPGRKHSLDRTVDCFEGIALELAFSPPWSISNSAPVSISASRSAFVFRR